MVCCQILPHMWWNTIQPRWRKFYNTPMLPKLHVPPPRTSRWSRLSVRLNTMTTATVSSRPQSISPGRRQASFQKQRPRSLSPYRRPESSYPPEPRPPSDYRQTRSELIGRLSPHCAPRSNYQPRPAEILIAGQIAIVAAAAGVILVHSTVQQWTKIVSHAVLEGIHTESAVPLLLLASNPSNIDDLVPLPDERPGHTHLLCAKIPLHSL